MDSDSQLDDICNWENKYNTQCEFVNKIIAKYKTLKSNEAHFITKIKQLEEAKKCNLAELCNYKIDVEEKICVIKSLKANLKSKEEELCYLFEQLSDSANNRLCADMMKRTKSECTDPCKSQRVKQACENRAQLEREALYCKFKVVCEKLQETKIAFDEAKSIINNDIFNIKNTATKMSKMPGMECDPHKMMCQIQQLIEENGAKDEEIYCMSKKIKKLQKENECNILKINKLKKTIANNYQEPSCCYKIDQNKMTEKNSSRFKPDHDCACLKKRLNNMYRSF